MKKKILIISNIIIPIILFAILLLNNMSSNFVYIMTLTLIVGWIIPFISPIITAISILTDKHHKLSLIFNIFSLLLSILLIILTILIYDSNLLLILIEYCILALLLIINIIYYIIYLHTNKDEEIANIKKIKRENNGIIK